MKPGRSKARPFDKVTQSERKVTRRSQPPRPPRESSLSPRPPRAECRGG